ncbi:LysR family transcriptional regulator [Microbulbifer hainanensis]|uniref:LysR family transcriptional regulator n=1 Tax=Microbulbifer hainanensis TaxID=2735675 RepID=UPI0018668B21|nr:LysR family transcriptional regulator [Microbulbifer hainanensis]
MNNLTLDQLRTFVAACEQGSFSAAARQMGRAQSAVSMQIQNLELDLGLDLFDRSGKFPRPTPAGTALLPLARQAIGQLQRFQQAADSFGRGEEPQLRIVFEELVMPDRLNDVLVAFAERFPDTRIESSTTSDENAVRRVAEGAADFAFVAARERYPDQLDFDSLGRQRVLPLAGPEHPLSHGGPISLQEAAAHRQIVTASPSGGRRWLLSPQTWRCDSLLQALDLASKGVGWTSAPFELARPFLKAGKLVELQLTSALSAWTLEVDLLWSGHTPQGLAARWFAREARRLYGNYYSPPIELADGI